MKNIYEILKSVGVEIPEDKKADFDKALNENYKTVNELEKVKTARDNFKSQLTTATDKLKEFEGVDVKDLQGEITKLNEQLSTQKADFEKQLEDRDFDDMINGEISKSGAKNSKAVRALLNLDELRASKNQSEDTKTALDKIKEENDYLFNSEEPLDNPIIVGKTTGQKKQKKSNEDLSKMSFEEYADWRKGN